MTDGKEKSPGLAAFLSFLIWGLGQVYVGRTREKTIFGGVLILIDIVGDIVSLSLFSQNSAGICILVSIIGLIFTVIIMLDAYNDAKEYNKEIQLKSKSKSDTILSTNGERILHTPQKFVDYSKQQLKGEETRISPPQNHMNVERNNIKKKPKFCSECGNKIEGNPKFCTECGNRLV